MMKGFYTVLFSLTIFFGYSQTHRSGVSVHEAPFYHGVASGDPKSDQMILWTRVTPPNGSYTEIPVFWQIATDIDFNHIVNFGKTHTTPAEDYTVKIDVCGLSPDTYYYYMFHAFGKNSIIGRTKTAPDGAHQEALFGVASCSNYEYGYFNAYESMAQRNDLDAVIHLGDYYYEYEVGGYSANISGREHEPTHESITLEDYRIRHSHYKLDKDLKRVHQIYPFVTTWDDHESANNSYKDGAENHNSGEGDWTTRKISSAQAYKEWMPIRNPDTSNDLKIWRSVEYGDLLDLLVVDSRLWERDEPDLLGIDDPGRTILGNDQFLWLENELSDTSSQWKIICNQVMMAPLEIIGIPVNPDQWDGYRSDRNRLINFVESNNIDNTVVLTGDIHSFWANNVPGNATSSAMVEYVVSSVTSPGIPIPGGQGLIQLLNPHMKYIDFDDRGYVLLQVDENKAQGDFIHVSVDDTTYSESVDISWYTNDGANSLSQANNSIAVSPSPPAPGRLPDQSLPFAIIRDSIWMTAQENTLHSECIIDVPNVVCPSIQTHVEIEPLYGSVVLTDFCIQYQPWTNYFGTDSMAITICQTTMNTPCDTVWLYFDIQGNTLVDTMYFSTHVDSVLEGCVSFDDLSTKIETISATVPFGSLTWTSDSCFEFTSDSTFCGVQHIHAVACDSVGICDVVVLEVVVYNYSETEWIEIHDEAGSLIWNCHSFEIAGDVVFSSIDTNGIGGAALMFNDTCISYQSLTDFEGIDTITMSVCDNFFPQKCDTVVYVMHITVPEEPVDTIHTNIASENTSASVIGVYPNPVHTNMIVQLYAFDQIHSLSVTLYDAQGKQWIQYSTEGVQEGLQYIQLNTEELAAGVYFLDIKTETLNYSQKILKK